MSDEPDVDPVELEAQLSQIKSAMGIDERYEGATTQWLLYGFLVPIAAAASQYVHLQELPGLYHPVIWVGVLFGGGFVGSWLWAGTDAENASTTTDGKPSLWFIFVAVYLSTFPLLFVVFRFTDGLGYDAQNALILGVALVMVGVAYLIEANVLRAYYIRSRDRYALYVGGILLVALGVAIATVDTLWSWGYAVFGALYFVYAMAAYVVLTRT
ncbi:hypothetical protein GJ629_10370 [Halapricum sp. CBA1109]|uniref:hypothetical protein n=1 Tax=Halapricum sp. CBA1109 TaxID=2668068 RepID=UPI0012FB4B2D|nr:hypothetical protein [Halapricum sp. CBA1109]MUV90245.1 hypothetical protein [Halapricum sp. CBA1109]